MPWWGWLILGGALAALELLGTAFYLIFFAVAAILMGLLKLIGVELPMWAEWLLFAVAAITAMLLLRKKLHERLHGSAPPVVDNTDVVEVREDVPVGARVRVKMRGSEWTATNVGQTAITAGSQARVVDHRGSGIAIEAVTTSVATKKTSA